MRKSLQDGTLHDEDVLFLVVFPRKRGRFFALVACDVHHCGFVTGAGLAVGREDAKQLAAQQVGM